MLRRFAGMACALVAFTGCGGSDGGPAGPTAFGGVWRLTQIDDDALPALWTEYPSEHGADPRVVDVTAGELDLSTLSPGQRSLSLVRDGVATTEEGSLPYDQDSDNSLVLHNCGCSPDGEAVGVKYEPSVLTIYASNGSVWIYRYLRATP